MTVRLSSDLMGKLPLAAQLRLEEWRHAASWTPEPPFYQDADLTDVPFFVVGAGRSGNTLLRRVLMAHPDVAIPPESYVLRKTVRAYQRTQGAPWSQRVDRVVSCFEDHADFHTWATDLRPVRQALSALPRSKRSYQAIIGSIYQAYVATHRPGAVRWGDKTPMNTLGLPALTRVFPQAQWIHLQRDGRDVVASYLDAGLYTSRRKAMERWVLSERYIARARREIGPERFLTVRYRDLVSDPSAVTEQVQRFLRLPVVPDLHTRRPPTPLGDTERYVHHANVVKPITPKSVGRWRRHPAFQAPVPAWFRRGLAAAGYDPDVAPARSRSRRPVLVRA